MSEENVNDKLDKAVDKAAEDANKGEGKGKEDEKGEVKDKDKDSKKDKVEDDDESDVIENEDEGDKDFTDEHKSLIKLLQNPRTAKQTVLSLAREFGLDLKEGTPKEVKKDLVTQLKDAMGDDFDLIPPKAWKAFELLIDEKLGEVREVLNQNERRQAEQEANKATNWLYREYDDAKKYEDDIIKLMGQYQFTPGGNQREYLEGLYLLAKTKKSSKSTKEEIAEKLQKRVERGKQDADSASGGAETGVKTGSGKRISIDEAISLAVQGKKAEN